jgi:hypothetical protein
VLFDYYLPGVNYRDLDDDEYFNKLAHLAVIRKTEAENRNL